MCINIHVYWIIYVHLWSPFKNSNNNKKLKWHMLKNIIMKIIILLMFSASLMINMLSLYPCLPIVGNSRMILISGNIHYSWLSFIQQQSTVYHQLMHSSLWLAEPASRINSFQTLQFKVSKIAWQHWWNCYT